MRPHRRQPTRLPCPWDSPGKNTGVGCHFFLQCMKMKSESEVTQSCPTLSDPMGCSPPGSSVYGISQARILDWVAISFSIPYFILYMIWASLVPQRVKNQPAMWETWVQSLHRELPWTREWQPTPVFLPGESYGQRSLAGNGPWCQN